NEVDKAKFVQAIREIDLAVVDIDAIQASDEREWGLYLWIPTVNLISKKENRLPIQVAVKRIREAESLLSPLTPNSKFSFNNLAEVVLANSQSILQLKNVKKELSKIRTWALESVNQSTGSARLEHRISLLESALGAEKSLQPAFLMPESEH
ncbi:hypothetical protein HDU84_001109, partial [Entophlyctis sp. JEL0112]